MKPSRLPFLPALQWPALLAGALATCLLAGAALAQPQSQEEKKEFVPYPGLPGKDVVWVPSPPTLTEHMLNAAKVTAKDYVIDLGSGDGRNVIGAAKRGASGLGVEYNPDLVVLSEKNAKEAGVSDRAKFLRGDMFEADISKATALILFLLPDNLRRLTPKFLDLQPGARIATGGFMIPSWDHDEVGRAEGDCGAWCTSYLYIVPAKVQGTWQMGGGTLTIDDQKFQNFSGSLTLNGRTEPVRNGRLLGDQITFSVGMTDYTGRVKDGTMTGQSKGTSAGQWRAVRTAPAKSG